jgi:HD-GYP domain-containing protein (c-di-GMP phosphodiesterase class II)
MDFNLNDFLRAVANSLDSVETDIFGVATNHSKRVAYISVKIASEFGLKNEEVFDLASLAIMHDNGASMKILHDNLLGTAKERQVIMESKQEHCSLGDDNLKTFPFLTNPQNIIKFHHEKFDGSGFFGIARNEIPLLAQIISLSDTLDLKFDLRNAVKKEEVITFVREYRNIYFSPLLSDLFVKISERLSFWEGLSDENIDGSLSKIIPVFSKNLSYSEIHSITETLSKIIDAKSKYTQLHSVGVSKKTGRMSEYYQIDAITRMKLLIAADLHDLGKLEVSNAVIDKPGKLTCEEYEEVKKHPQLTRTCLQNISGFEDISRWAGNHHERLDGSGYPDGLYGEALDFNSRLLACVDVYQALREKRPYRKSMDHKMAAKTLSNMAKAGKLDHKIVDDINSVFSSIMV